MSTDDLIIHSETGPQRLIGYVLDVSNSAGNGGARCWLANLALAYFHYGNRRFVYFH